MNVLIAQSGGPSPVVNNTLRGIIDACQSFPDTFGTMYGGWHGIEGVLKEALLNLSAQDVEEVRLLAFTPAAGAVGTCRYKLRDECVEDFERVIEVLQVHGIGYFFYTGGNDSMDTAVKLANSQRVFPADWISDTRYDVTDGFVRYAQPLISENGPEVPLVGGLSRFARFERIFAKKSCGYTPAAHRT